MWSYLDFRVVYRVFMYFWDCKEREGIGVEVGVGF